MKKRLEEEFANRGIEKEVKMDSLLVFSTPKRLVLGYTPKLSAYVNKRSMSLILWNNTIITC